MLLPELGLCGYPLKDFLEVPEFRRKAKRAMDELCTPADWNRGIAVYLGGIEPHDGPGPRAQAGAVQRSVWIAARG